MSAVLARTVVVRHPDTLAATALLAGEPLPDWASDLVGPDALDGADDSDGGYADMKAADLKAEIEKRNEGRADDAKLSTSGNKAELVAALVADDAASA